jgi:glutamyl/glutaminyl-tRNA synthetase
MENKMNQKTTIIVEGADMINALAEHGSESDNPIIRQLAEEAKAQIRKQSSETITSNTQFVKEKLKWINSAAIEIESNENLIKQYEKMLKGKYKTKELRQQHKTDLAKFKYQLKNWIRAWNQFLFDAKIEEL